MKTLEINDHHLVGGKITQDLLNYLLTYDITGLDFTGCSDLKYLPQELPNSLTKLDFTGCSALKYLPKKLPNSLTKLNLKGCSDIKSLPNLPTSLTKLDLTGCDSLTSLPENLPTNLTELNLTWCSNITSLPELPTNLTKLDLTWCSNITSLPEKLPTSLTELNLAGCYSLTSLPELPTSLTKLNLGECYKLEYTPQLMARLNALLNAGFSVVYPLHFARNAINAAGKTLNQAIKKYTQSNTNVAAPSDIKTLLWRYLAEDIYLRYPDRDKGTFFKDIAESVMPILEVFTENQNHLEWAEEVAKHYLQGCVNQPVVGWSEISAYASMAMQKNTIDKITASAHLRVLDVVKAYVTGLPTDKKPGQAVEVEAGNALFREVHNKLLSEKKIEKPWPAVPKEIAYEETIKKWLTKDKITPAYNLAVKELKKQLRDVAKDLLEKEHWGKIAFPNEVKKIEESYKDEKQELQNKIGDIGMDDSQYASKTNKLDGEYKELESDQQTEIYDEVKKLTDQAINPPKSTQLKRAATTQLGDNVQKKSKAIV